MTIDTSETGVEAGTEPLLEAVDVTKHFRARGNLFRRGGVGRVVHAVEGVSLRLYAGHITALVGESGSGKSTLARLLAQLYPLTSGAIRYLGEDVDATSGRAFRDHVSRVQLILQDPFGSFNPVATIASTLGRAVRLHHPDANAAERDAIIEDLLAQVNLAPAKQFTEKYPHELSGGQLQRISIARALAANPRVFLADEPVSSLDVSIRLGVLNLLRRLTIERNVALLYVTHDIASARYFAAETAVMYAGELIEHGPSEEVTQRAAHPYTQLLIASAPDPSRAETQRISDIGQPPSLIDPPKGCRFHPRCPFAMERCKTDAPPSFDLPDNHSTRCWMYADDEEARSRLADNRVSVEISNRPADVKTSAQPGLSVPSRGEQVTPLTESKE
jgi:peptide/nickel transport system ATP-binding protein